MCIDFIFLLQTPESQKGLAVKCLSDITASEQFCNAAKKQIFVDPFSHDDSTLPKSKESTPNPLMKGLLTQSWKSTDTSGAVSRLASLAGPFRFVLELGNILNHTLTC